MNLRLRKLLLALTILACAVAGRTSAATGITGSFSADVGTGTTIQAGQPVHVKLAFSSPYNAILQVYINVEGMDVSGISPAPKSVDPLKQGDTVIGTSILWDHAGSFSGEDSVTCTPNLALAQAAGHPGFGSVAGGVNSGDGAGNGGLVRVTGPYWRNPGPSKLNVAVQATVKPAPKSAGAASPGSTVHYVLTGTDSGQASSIVLTNTLPDHVKLLPKSVTPASQLSGGKLSWTFTGKSSVQASFDVQIDAADKIPLSVDKITDRLHGDATQSEGGTLTADAQSELTINDGSLTMTSP